MTTGRSLPASLHPLRFVDLNRELRGKVSIAGMRRLAGSLVTPTGMAEIALRFSKDEARRPVIEGQIEATLPIICQRCMRTMDLPLKADVSLGIVQSEQEAEQLPEHLDPLLVDEEPIWLADLIEDELILGLPAIAMHPTDSSDCRVLQTAGKGTEIKPADASEDVGSKENPFAVLANLKKGKGSTDLD